MKVLVCWIELIRVGRKRIAAMFAKRQRQSVKQLIRAVPDVTMRAQVELGFEPFQILQADSAVNAVSRDQQITVVSQRLDIVDFST